MFHKFVTSPARRLAGGRFIGTKRLVLISLVLVLGFATLLFASEPPLSENLSSEEFSNLIDQPFPGSVFGEGTYFKIAESEYLTVSLTSTEKIQAFLESIPRIVSFGIESKSGATSTVLNLSGFEPNKTYYRYQDGELAGEFTTDTNGIYTYTQDLSKPHHIFILEDKNGMTIYIRPDGSVDPVTAPISVNNNVYTFTNNIYQTIVVEKDNIIIDGNGYALQGPGIYGFYLYGRRKITIRNTNLQGFTDSILLFASPENAVVRNVVSGSRYGIELYRSNDNLLDGNTISNSATGIYLHMSPNCILRNNLLNNNQNPLYVSHDLYVSDFFQDIDTTNLVDGKPLYYWVNKENMQIPTDAGWTGVINSKNIAVKDLTLHSIFFAFTTNSQIENMNCRGIRLVESDRNSLLSNTISNSAWRGISLLASSTNLIDGNIISSNPAPGIGIASLSKYNIIRNNVISNNWPGIRFDMMTQARYDNKFYHNNFIDNWILVGPRRVKKIRHIYPGAAGIHIWDDGYPSGGNYWSDYTGVDNYSGPNQDQPATDGIGDDPYVIDAYNQDLYPLMTPWGEISAAVEIDPDTLNLKSKGKWITAYIELPSEYSVSDIRPETVKLNNTVPAETKPTEIGDYDSDGIPDLMVKFDRGALQELLNPGEVELTVTGKIAGKSFKGSDKIKVITPPTSAVSAGSSFQVNSLGQNYPNPFNPATTIEYSIEKDCQVTIKLYNVAGQEVTTLVDEFQTAGPHKLVFNEGDELSRGIYYYQMKAGNFVDTKKMVVLK